MTHATCPCCRQRLPPHTIAFDPRSGYLAYNSLHVKLPLYQSIVFATLLQHAPETVDYARITFALYRHSEGPIHERNTIKAITCHLRQAIRPLGFDIEVTYKVGYRLILPQPTATTEPPTCHPAAQPAAALSH